MLFSPTLRVAGRTAISVLSNIFGLDGEMYYPKGYDSARSGYDDEIQYSDTPDWTGKFLAPFIFGGSKVQYGGFFDELNGDEKAIFFDDLSTVPIGSLMVFKLPAGEQLYKIDDLVTNNDEFGSIYKKVIVVPVTKINEHTPVRQELQAEYIDEVIEKGINEDTSADEFLNDLLGEPMKDLKTTQTQRSNDTEIIVDSFLNASTISLDLEDEDLLE
jgi:hypothetical protein